jgi:hypothetical protein
MPPRSVPYSTPISVAKIITSDERKLPMLTHPTSERLIALGLAGMARALDEQRHAQTSFEALGFEDRLGLLVDREATERDAKRPVSKTSICAFRAASTAPSWPISSMVVGLGAMRTY